MTSSNSGVRTWRDPWPSPQAPYPDPPWRMRGRSVTAWFDAPWDAVASVLSQDLMPPISSTVRARLRFYDLKFQGSGPPRAILGPQGGRFKECVVAFTARGGGVDGEVSLFLWTDSLTYLTWGRESFGWPIGLAKVNLTGSLWSAATAIGCVGDAELQDDWGSASLRNVEIQDRAESGTPGGRWLTPRRVLHAAGCDGETRELLDVRPELKKPGTSWLARGELHFDFAEDHPLCFLNVIDQQTDLEVADDFELLVGANVVVVGAEPASP